MLDVSPYSYMQNKYVYCIYDLYNFIGDGLTFIPMKQSKKGIGREIDQIDHVFNIIWSSHYPYARLLFSTFSIDIFTQTLGRYIVNYCLFND